MKVFWNIIFEFRMIKVFDKIYCKLQFDHKTKIKRRSFILVIFLNL